jgi:hypothetical protein
MGSACVEAQRSARQRSRWRGEGGAPAAALRVVVVRRTEQVMERIFVGEVSGVVLFPRAGQSTTQAALRFLEKAQRGMRDGPGACRR